MTTPSWLVLANNGLRCQRCGKVEPMPLPMPVDGFTPWCEYIGAVHKGCPDTGRLDMPAASVREWIDGPDTGISSKAIYRHMMGLHEDNMWGAGHPTDPSDFGRCYRLLKLEPSWRARIREMAKYGPEWAALTEAWDELTSMYERRTSAGTTGQPGMLYTSMSWLLADVRSRLVRSTPPAPVAPFPTPLPAPLPPGYELVEYPLEFGVVSGNLAVAPLSLCLDHALAVTPDGELWVVFLEDGRRWVVASSDPRGQDAKLDGKPRPPLWTMEGS